MAGNIKSIKVKDKIIGEKEPNICTPLVGRTEDELVIECENILSQKPDIIEWRADYFNDVKDIQRVIYVLNKIRNIIPDYPIIFTCRIAGEGGFKEIDEDKRLDLAKAVMHTKLIDLIDIELINGEKIIKEIIDEAHNNDVYVIVSHHNFTKTPPKDKIIEKLQELQICGADMAKIAVMPHNFKDVLTLLEAALEFKEKHAEVPLIAISMSEKGIISRVGGHLFGSSITFASGKSASAPGQIPIAELRASMDLLSKSL